MNKIVLYGPPLSGKRTLLEALARAYRVAVHWRRRPDELAALECFVTLKTPGGDVELATFTGAVWSESDWDRLLDESTVVALVCDLQRGCVDANKDARDRVAPWLPERQHLAILTKADLPLGWFRARHLLDMKTAIATYDLEGWDVFISSRTKPALDALTRAVQKLS